jgi:excisionase family DNA binding protein
MGNKANEVTVEQASALLGVTSRSVINYIKTKEIEAIKVGKVWHINRASLDVFK